jgi:hypothetical protein
MIPGTISKLSEQDLALATTIAPQKDVVRITDTTSTTVVATITPAFGGQFAQAVTIINLSGANLTTVTTGNINTAVTVGQNVAIKFVYSAKAGKWYPGALA